MNTNEKANRANEQAAATLATILDQETRDRPAAEVVMELRKQHESSGGHGWYATLEQALLEDLLLLDEGVAADLDGRFGDLTGSIRVMEDETGDYWFLFDCNESGGTPATVDGLANMENWFDFRAWVEEQG